MTMDAAGTIRVWITAPPADDAANVALVKFVAKTLGLKNSAIKIIRGHHSRIKTLRADGLTLLEICERLQGDQEVPD